MEARVFYDITIIGKIQNLVWALLRLEEFHTIAILAQQYYLFPVIQIFNNHLISQDMVKYIIANNLKFLVVTRTGI